MAKKINIDIEKLDKWIWDYASAKDLDSKCDLIYKYHNSDSNGITLTLYEVPYNNDTITESYYLTIPLVDGKLMSVDNWLKKYGDHDAINTVLVAIENAEKNIAKTNNDLMYHKASIKFCEEQLQLAIRQREEQVARYKALTGDDYDALILDHGDE